MRNGVLAASLAGFVAMLFPASAVCSSAQVTLRPGDDATRAARLIYEAERGEANRVLVRAEMASGEIVAWIVKDGGARLSTGRGCERKARGEARCPLAAGAHPLRPSLRLGNRDDYARVVGDAHVFGGPGDDTIRALGAALRINPGAGKDVLHLRAIGSPSGNRPPTSRFVVRARDGQSDWIECGEADETLVVDSLDFGSAFCERVRRRGAARAVMSRHASISTHEDYPDYLTIEGVGCPGDFRYPHCNVRFAFSQQGKRIDRSNPVKLGTGDYNMHDVYMIRGTAFDFDRSPSGSGWAGRVLLTLRSEDSRGRSYTLRQAVPFRIRAELFLNVPP